MKKMVKILLITLISVIGINTANAAEFTVGEGVNIIMGNDTTVSGLSYRDETGTYRYSNYTYTCNTNSNGTINAYCLDPSVKEGTNYTVDRILGAGNTSGEPNSVTAYDIGTVKILSLGYSDFTTSGYGVSGNDFYNATSIALRTFLLGLYDWGYGSTADYYLYKTSVLAKTGAQWAGKYSSYASIATGKCTSSSDPTQCFLNSIKSTYKWYSDSASFVYSDGTTAANVMRAAEQLFLEGVTAAAEYMQGGATASEISYEVGRAVQEERTEDTVREYIIIDFNIKNFPEDGVITGFSVTPTTNNNGITIESMEYSVDGSEYTTLSADMDVSKLIEAQDGLRTGSIKIKLNIVKEVNEDCSNMNFTINYRYNDPSKEFQGAILKPSATNKQRFLVVTKLEEGEYTEGTINGTIACASEVCETQLSVPICSDDPDEAISEITAPENIKKCIIDNSDEALNSYQLSASNGGIDNDYCKVFCKEDYRDVIDDGIQGGIKLNPVIEDVNCGGYFQLTSHVEGKKDCYTGGDTDDKSIDKEQFMEDLQNAQSTMIMALGWKEAIDIVTDEATFNSQYFIETPVDCTDDPDQTCYSYTYSIPSITITQPVEPGEEDYQVDSTESAYRFDIINTAIYDNVSAEDRVEKRQEALEAFMTEAENKINQTMKAELSEYGIINSGVTSYSAAMEQASTQLENIIRDYNGCTSAWSNEFLFNQRLKFYYNEYHFETEYVTYYQLLEDFKDEELYYLDAVEDSLIEESEIEICLSTTNEEYECEDESFVYDGATNFTVDEMNVITELIGDIYETQTVTICNSDGCTEETQNISNATFVRKTVKKSQDYITPSVFYQIEANGRITINSGYEGNALKLEQLINSLPVSPSTTGGGLFKLLLEDLGEFYEDGTTGRLIDFDDEDTDDKISVAEKKEEDGIQVFDGEYTCHYYSPCRPEECPNCDFTCDEEGCEWIDCPDCNFTCVNCLFNLNDLQTIFRPISSTNVTSAEREYGYNWDVNTTLAALELLKDKATITISEIEENNETIFDEDVDTDADKVGEDSELDFSIRLTADVINTLKEYNVNVEGEGGYGNDSLTCYDAEINGQTVANLYCYSEVIDELVERYPSQIIVYNRTDANGRSDANANTSGYWELWSGWFDALDQNGDGEIDKNANGQNSVIGGPAWR